MIYLTDQVHPGIASSSATRSGDNVPCFFAFRWVLCHSPALFSSVSLDFVEGVFCNLLYCVIQVCFCSSHMYVFSLPHSQPCVTSSLLIRSCVNVPFLYAARWMLCHIPARFSSGSLDI